ncbi:response regulator [Pseudomonas entomophila]|uniref:ATP-binding protein n=1 Tax=Pseudomonas entomophila TaxID=312306 RepID=UPI0023D8B958|nr:ATP-binding protein [Pseudomonas entomophila]MDF0732995.1 response regulator [Pseudomonas entomophila]
MAAALALDERALILAPDKLGTATSRLLTRAGIGCRVTANVVDLGPWLDEGVGLVIVAEQAMVQDAPSPLQQFIDLQPVWSDLPVVLLTLTTADHRPAWDRLGNLTRLACPFEDAQLLMLAAQALRARRRQYLARDHLAELQQCQHRQHADDQALYRTRKMEAIGQLAGGVAHDFNNFLTSIGGSLELIDKRLRQGRTQDLESVLRMGQEAVSRAARLTHRLLAFSSRQSLSSQAVNLHVLLQPPRLREKLTDTVKLRVQLPADLWPLSVDEQQLKESLDNLLANACEAMPSGGLLSIVACNQHIEDTDFAGGALAGGDYLCLSVIDNGQGMPESIQDHAFEPFFSTKPVGQGVGLGLSMVYGFSKQSHGHVALHSQIGRGTRVDLYLPRFRGTPPVAQAVPPEPSHSLSREILVVEDDPHVRTLLCQALHDDGFTCHSASNANEALLMLRSPHALALLVSDVGLPGMNGRQLAEIARKLRPGLPVLFITGYAQTAMSRDDFLDAGMQLICKPFELQQLRERVAQMLGER